MEFQIEAELEFELLQNFNLIGNLKEVNIEVTKFETYFQSRVTLAQMNSKVKSMQEPFTKMVNTLLTVGQGLPVPKQFAGELSKTRLFSYDHFLMIETDPKVEKLVTEKVVKVREIFKRELNNFL